MSQTLDDAGLDLVFRHARTRNGWTDAPVSDADIRRLYDLVALAPTSANSSPARFIFCSSTEARSRLAACASGTNAAKILAAPVTVIIGMDMEFHEQLPKLFPHTDARSWFAGKPDAILDATFRNSSLQGGYLILAARALGFDVGPMSGFDKSRVDAEFWAGTGVVTNFLCSIGVGNDDGMFPRNPRLAFEDAAQIL